MAGRLTSSASRRGYPSTSSGRGSERRASRKGAHRRGHVRQRPGHRGLEYEFYAVGTESHELRRVPRDLLDCLGFEKELRLHSAELNAGVYPCNGPGLAALSKDVESKVASFQRQAAEEGVRFVSDGMWTIGPEYNTPDGYLTEATHEEGLTLAISVSNAVRYHGFATIPPEPGGRLDFPGATVEADSPGPVGLTTSIQPHYQCRRAADLPDHFRTAVRLAGPLLAVGVNSSFLRRSCTTTPTPIRPSCFGRAGPRSASPSTRR